MTDLPGTRTSVVITIFLSVSSFWSCRSQTTYKQDEVILDLDSVAPLIAYTLTGQELENTDNVSRCDLAGPVRDAFPNGILHDEIIFASDGIQVRWAGTVARDFSGNRFAAFAPIPADADIRLAPDNQQVAFSACLIQKLKGCRCGLALAHAGEQGWERLWCSPGDTSSPDALSWSPDSKVIAFSIDHQVFLSDVATRRTEYLARGDVPRWSPLGKDIAFVNDGGDGIVTMNPVTRRTERHPLPVHGIAATGLEWSPDSAFFTIVSRTDEQPGDSRVRTALGIVDSKTWAYRDLGVRLWGTKHDLRWVDLPGHDLGRLSRLIANVCRSPRERRR